MGTYNLNDNVNDSFEFEVGGHKYKTTYPNTEELEQLRELVRNQNRVEENGRGVDDATVQRWLYGFIKPVGEGSPEIAEVMKKQNVRVLLNFKEMLKAEFGLDQ